MTRYKKIKVLIVDDSLLFQEILKRGLQSDSKIEIIATAQNPFEARDKILQYKPDVMICDVEMPKMNGIEFIKRLLPQYIIPVIVVSSANAAVFDAMEAGAIDFVPKPNMTSTNSVEQFILSLISKIHIAYSASIKDDIKAPTVLERKKTVKNEHNIIAIGSSTGGTEAINYLLKSLPSNLPGIVIVQHIPPIFSALLAERLNDSTQFQVKEAETGDYVEMGKVIIAPGDKHMRLKKVGDTYRIECFEDQKINGHCPSVDVLFESVSKEAGSKAIGIILTGMGYDGAKGLLSMRRKGARTIGQDSKSSVVYGMPKVAYEVGAVEKQVSLSDIPKMLLSMIN